MFSPSSLSASAPEETADWACSTTPVATRFTRSSGEADARRVLVVFLALDFLAPPRGEDARLADDFFALDLRAPPFLAAAREAEPVVFRAVDFFTADFFAPD